MWLAKTKRSAVCIKHYSRRTLGPRAHGVVRTNGASVGDSGRVGCPCWDRIARVEQRAEEPPGDHDRQHWCVGLGTGLAVVAGGDCFHRRARPKDAQRVEHDIGVSTVSSPGRRGHGHSSSIITTTITTTCRRVTVALASPVWQRPLPSGPSGLERFDRGCSAFDDARGPASRSVAAVARTVPRPGCFAPCPSRIRRGWLLAGRDGRAKSSLRGYRRPRHRIHGVARAPMPGAATARGPAWLSHAERNGWASCQGRVAHG